MQVNKERVRDLLGAGLPNEVVASTVGCDPSYISQLMSDEQFALSVIEIKTKTLVGASTRDQKLGDIEDSLIDKIKELVDGGMVYKTQDIVRLFMVMNSAKRRGVTNDEKLKPTTVVVQLQLPASTRRKYTINNQGEVVEVDGQTLVTMPAHTLLQNLSETKGKTENEDPYARLRRFLPNAQTIVHDVDGS